MFSNGFFGLFQSSDKSLKTPLYIEDIKYDPDFEIRHLTATYNLSYFNQEGHAKDYKVNITTCNRVTTIQGNDGIDKPKKQFGIFLTDKLDKFLTILTYQELHKYYIKKFDIDIGPCPGNVHFCNFYMLDFVPYYIYDENTQVIYYSDSKEELISKLDLQP